MRFTGKYKILLVFSVLVFCFRLQSQIIAPINFSVTGPTAPIGTHINAVVEDSVNNRLYIQSSCICGTGPGNVYGGLTYANVLTNVIGPTYFQYNPFFVEAVSSGLHYSNNSVYTNDGVRFLDFNVPAYSNIWTHSVSVVGNQSIVATAMRNDSIFMITEDNAITGGCHLLDIRNRNTGAQIPFNTIGCSTFTSNFIIGHITCAKIYRNILYLAGGFDAYGVSSVFAGSNIAGIDLTTGNVINLNFLVNDTIRDIKIYNNMIHICGDFTSVKGQPRNRYAMLDLAGNLQSNTPMFDDLVAKIEPYDNYLIAMGKFTSINGNTVNPFADYVIKAVDLNSNSIMNWNMPYYNPAGFGSFMMERSRNRLFGSNRNFNGYYLDAFCLPPIKTTSVISTPTTAFCAPGNNQTFSITPFTYASAYNWSYTGIGATITGTSNIVNVNFGAGATSGKLKVCALSSCGSVSDTLSISITIYPRPNITASLVDDTLNCFKPKVPILGNSTTPGVGYAWSGPLGYTSAQQNDSTGYNNAGVYTLTVTTLATGCTSTASVLVRIDTVKPNVTLPPGPYLVGCGTSSLITLNGSSTTTPTTLWWKNSSLTTYTANPASVSLGNYFLEARNTYNGCKNTSSVITVSSSAALPTLTLTTHTFFNSTTPVDTITCIKTSVTLSVSCTPTNCSVVWKDISTNTITSNPVTVYGGGNQMPIVTRPDNFCVDSSKIVFVDQNITPPNILILTPNANINCSSSTATLSAAFSPTPNTAVWTGPSSFSSVNPAITSVQGMYYFTVTRSDNGCSKKDSVNIGYSNTLVVDAGKDTTVCKNSSANLSAIAIGTLSPITYSWSSGPSSQTISVNPVVTTSYVVTANGPSGCTGKDTVLVNIPADMQDSIVTAKSCTGNSGSLSIFVKGGIAPYKYSVNGSPFTTQTTYTNLAFATYSISIKDSIGCILNTSASITQNSNLITPVFIASTQNFKGDTVVFIDLTIPKADSINWVLPTVASIIGGDMFNPVVVFADTGSFPVTLQAFYGNCMTSSTKIIKIMPWDSAYATLSNGYGIKTLNLYPNPNNGQFTVQIEFYKKQNASIQIWDSQPQKHFQQNFLNTDVINLPVNVSQLTNGTYVLRVIGEYASKHFYFVISQ